MVKFIVKASALLVRQISGASDKTDGAADTDFAAIRRPAPRQWIAYSAQAFAGACRWRLRAWFYRLGYARYGRVRVYPAMRGQTS